MSNALVCPQGHAVIDSSARFCQSCGATLIAAPVSFACAVHPERSATSTCPRCGSFACGECLIALPDGSSLCAACVARESEALPWDRRDQVGTLRGFWQTCVELIRAPSRRFAAARKTGGVGDSLWFSTLAMVTAWFTTFALYGVMFVGIFAAIALGEEKNAATGLGVMVGAMAAMFILAVGGGMGLMLANAALDQLVLKLIGARPKSFPVTLRASALSLAPALAGLVPFCGYYAFLLWAVVLRVYAYRAFHGITTGKAAAGALLVPGIAFTAAATLYFVAILWSQTMAAGG